MLKQNKNKNKQKNASTNRSAQRSRNRKLKKLKQKEARNAREIGSLERWSFGLEDLSLGPLSLGSAHIGSRNAQRMVGVAPLAQKVQVEMPTVMVVDTEEGPVHVLVGTERITNVDSTADNVAGDILVEQLISPSAFVDTRIFQFAPLYEKYKFLALQFIYEPIAPATQSGQVLGFVEVDALSPLPGSEPANVQRGAAHEAQAVNQVWQQQIYETGIRAAPNWYYTNNVTPPDERWVYQGIFYLLSASDQVPTTALGQIYVRYAVAFKTPQLGDVSVPLPSSPMLATVWSGSMYTASVNTEEAKPINWNNIFGSPGEEVAPKVGAIELTTLSESGRGLILEGLTIGARYVVALTLVSNSYYVMTTMSSPSNTIRLNLQNGADYDIIVEDAIDPLYQDSFGAWNADAEGIGYNGALTSLCIIEAFSDTVELLYHFYTSVSSGSPDYASASPISIVTASLLVVESSTTSVASQKLMQQRSLLKGRRGSRLAKKRALKEKLAKLESAKYKKNNKRICDIEDCNGADCFRCPGRGVGGGLSCRDFCQIGERACPSPEDTAERGAPKTSRKTLPERHFPSLEGNPASGENSSTRPKKWLERPGYRFIGTDLKGVSVLKCTEDEHP